MGSRFAAVPMGACSEVHAWLCGVSAFACGHQRYGKQERNPQNFSSSRLRVPQIVCGWMAERADSRHLANVALL
jgi:hypothetical protein